MIGWNRYDFAAVAFLMLLKHFVDLQIKKKKKFVVVARKKIDFPCGFLELITTKESDDHQQ